MKVEARLTGIEEIAAALRALPEAVAHDVLIREGRTVLKPVLEDVQARAPYDPHGTVRHLRDSYQILVPEEQATGTARVQIGIPRGKAYPHQKLALMHERGTVKMAAHPHLRPAMDSRGQSMLMDLAQRVLRRAMTALKKMRPA